MSKGRSAKTVILWIIGICLIIVACFGLIIGLSDFNGYVVRGTRPIPGDAAKFDPITTYPQITQYAVQNAAQTVQLLRIDWKFVKADGTLDFTADYGAEARYQFAHVLEGTPANAAPLGAGGSTGGSYAERIDVTVSKPEPKGGSKNQYYDFGMQRDVIDATPLKTSIAETPKCSLKRLWDAAIKQDAPANAVATIHYDSTGYIFTITGTEVSLQFDTSCQLKS